MNIAIFGDDKSDLERIENAIIESKIIVNIVLKTDNSNEIINYLLFNDSPLLFILDIVAEEKTIGFELCNKILSNNERNSILFITNNPQHIIYNIDYKLASICFILKDSKNFKLEVKRVLENCSKELDDTNYYSIYTKSVGTINIHYDDIYFFEKVKNSYKICVHHSSGESIFTGNLKTICNELKHFIVRCHGSYAVNPKYIENIITSEKKIIFKNGLYCFYSRFYRKELKKWMK